jgi:RND family efflux transporter MFP subunit
MNLGMAEIMISAETGRRWKAHRGASAIWRLRGTALALATTAMALAGCHEQPVPAAAPPTVKVAQVVRAGSAGDLRISGTLDAERSIPLSFGEIGTVQQVLVQEGDFVPAGKVLARLNPRTYEDEIGVAQATSNRAADALHRIEPMHKNQTIAEIKVVEAQTGVQQAEHTLSIARKNLDDTYLRAPQAGIVARRAIEPGQTAIPGAPAIVLMQIGSVMAVAPVPETQIGKVKRGEKVRVAIPALGKSLTGEVHEIAVIADPLTRTFNVKITLANPSGELRVGMIAEIYLHTEGGTETLAVPPEAIRTDETGHPCVFVATPDGKLQRRRVEVTGFAGEQTAVANGVHEGELVVVSGTAMLADGIRAHISNAQAQGAGR